MEESPGRGRRAAGRREQRQLSGDETEEPSLAQLAELRGMTYGLFGNLLHLPADDEPAEYAGLAAELRRRADAVRTFPFFPTWCSLLDSLTGFDGKATGLLQAEYRALFSAGASSSCHLYESAYLERYGPTQGLVGVAVERAYADAGAALRPAAAGELPDHVALELEFLSLLCDREARGWRESRPERAGDSLRAQQEFLDAHLLRWLPQLTRGLIDAAEASFYRRLAEAMNAFVVHDRDLVGALETTCASPRRSRLAAKGAADR